MIMESHGTSKQRIEEEKRIPGRRLRTTAWRDCLMERNVEEVVHLGATCLNQEGEFIPKI